MSTTGGSLATEGFYSKLIDDEPVAYDYNHRSPDVGHRAHPVSPVKLNLGAKAPGPYRLATICLATLCVVLLISIIAVTAHYKSKPQGGGEATSELQKQKQGANMSDLIATISKLQQEKAQLQKEKGELLAKLDAKIATTAPQVVRPTVKVSTPTSKSTSTSTSTSTSSIVCPTGWHRFGNSCYFISSRERSTWSGSETRCQKKGGHLAIIHTAEEQTFIWDLLPRAYWNAFWFGITDEHAEDDWKWVDGTPVVGTFWEYGEPNNHNQEDCGYMIKTDVLTRVAIRSWYDAPCSMSLPFICEKEMVPSSSASMSH
ncbi:C-type lectin domain family 4 member M-like [Scomber scombrus]|uniref:C-type lectin domain family 4 member M-like n=1 Tax=Scomber scombrus TaxID=13677 RepID=UPI002DDBAF1E|nr:C-type lectin domain family 4 member M-like [Scomber scombrus]